MSGKKTLLLTSTYEVDSFISEKKAIRLLFASEPKVEIISSWDDISIEWISGNIKYPSILRLLKNSRKNYFNSNFSRKALVKRDRSLCQYCAKKLSKAQITIDHVIPKAQGGKTSFSNCVVCCHVCNNKKADKTPEQAGLKLLKKPTHPSFSANKVVHDGVESVLWNPDWDDHLSNI